MNKKEYAYHISVGLIGVAIAAVVWFFILNAYGCTLFGSNTPVSVKPSPKIKANTEAVAELKQNYKDIQGDIISRTEITEIVSTQVKMEIKTAIDNSKHETPFWQIWLPLAGTLIGGYIIWEIVKYTIIKPRIGKK